MNKPEFRIFATLWLNGDWMTRNQIKRLTGKDKGYSAAIGAFSKGTIRRGSLMDMGYVETKLRGDRKNELLHRITPAGRRAIKKF